MHASDEDRDRFFVTELSRRLVRTCENDEAGAFVRWVARLPFIRDHKVNNLIVVLEKNGQEFENSDEEDDNE